MGKGSAPPPPPPSQAETDLMNKQSAAIDQYMKQLDSLTVQNKEAGLVAKVASGLYEPVYDGSGALVDAKISAARVTDLKSDYDQTRRMALLQNNLYEKALKGDQPVSEGLSQQKAKEFGLLKEAASRRGTQIMGETLDEAKLTPQDSTAGNELIGNLSRTYGLLEDQDRHRFLGLGGTDAVTPRVNTVYSGVDRGGASVSGYGGAAGLYGAAMQPYQFNRSMQFQFDQNNAALSASRANAVAGLIGQVGGTAAGLYAINK